MNMIKYVTIWYYYYYIFLTWCAREKFEGRFWISVKKFVCSCLLTSDINIYIKLLTSVIGSPICWICWNYTEQWRYASCNQWYIFGEWSDRKASADSKMSWQSFYLKAFAPIFQNANNVLSWMVLFWVHATCYFHIQV